MIILCVELQRFHRWRPCKNNSKSVLKFKFHHHNCSILIVMNCLMYVCVCMCMCAYICICLRDSRCACGTTKLPPKTPRHLANSQLWEQKKTCEGNANDFWRWDPSSVQHTASEGGGVDIRWAELFWPASKRCVFGCVTLLHALCSPIAWVRVSQCVMWGLFHVYICRLSPTGCLLVIIHVCFHYYLWGIFFWMFCWLKFYIVK